MISMRQGKRYCLLFFICLMLISLTACHSRYGGSTYSGAQARQAQYEEWGVIESMDYVLIKDQNTGVAAAGGAVAGGVIGSSIVRPGPGRLVGGAIGALAGAAIGYGVEEAATTREALEYVVRLEDGARIVVVQEDDGYEAPFRPGDHVRVLTSRDGSVRIRR